MEITTMNNEERIFSDYCFSQEMENRNFSYMYICMFGFSHKDIRVKALAFGGVVLSCGSYGVTE